MQCRTERVAENMHRSIPFFVSAPWKGLSCFLKMHTATVLRGLLQARVGGRPYSERMLGQVVCMTQWMQEQRAELGFSEKGESAPSGACDPHLQSTPGLH